MSDLGRLYLIPTWLSEDTPPEQVIAAPLLVRVRSIEAFVAENAKSARRFLAACSHPKALREIEILELNEHTRDEALPALLAPALAGRDLGLLSEAGAPAVADPGASLVAAAHAKGVVVVPLPGPSSIVLALMASGLEGQRFRFHGYLPAQSPARRALLAEIERHSARHAETQIFIETPYRNDALLADILGACREATRLAVAAELTSPREWIRMDPIGRWRERPVTIGKRPAIFLLLAESR
ncbi:MAG TPA: SAM-dependent methyltransferase [Usitatibacter sp.]|nr:SAM-dependent methyltransferase [Usitatibacter sp.]